MEGVGLRMNKSPAGDVHELITSRSVGRLKHGYTKIGSNCRESHILTPWAGPTDDLRNAIVTTITSDELFSSILNDALIAQNELALNYLSPRKFATSNCCATKAEL